MSRNFWSNCKHFIDCPRRVLPTFEKTTFNTYFKKAFSCTNPFKVFTIPNWIDPFPQLTCPFNTSPPTYHGINKIILNEWKHLVLLVLKSNINLFQKMPVSTNLLTGYLQRDLGNKRNSINMVQSNNNFYKKDHTNDPSNFRPRTLEPVALKVLTSLIRDWIYSFLASNNYLENEIQKGFVPGMSDT